MDWLAVYSRELLLLQKKMGKLGYIFSTVMFPLIYLFAFGLGIGFSGERNAFDYGNDECFSANGSVRQCRQILF